ncbi:hypothetical protein BROUX41_003703 [Berkeleyomyces rouxiae]|uniref:uncharacterized protein n=1 Tax=Berkeleyomyces rouxiae TaxID=2035830 RepID=UPI003B82216A
MESSTPNASTDKVHDPTTPKKVTSKTNVTPKSAPAAAGGSRGRTPVRRIDTLPPSLLTDFFLGRPSPARRAALKARRESMDAIKAELRQEMRAEAVRKVQPPGGVRDRVKKWQKNNAAAMAAGDPQATPSEPGDIAFESDDHSVTEEDRIRIRSQKKNAITPKRPSVQKYTTTNAKRVVTPKKQRIPDLNHGSRSLPSKINQAPKKRVVSDDHWMKIKLKKKPSHRRRSPNTTQRIPKDFTHKTMNPPAVMKVRDWVDNVQIPNSSRESPPLSPTSPPLYRNHKHSQSVPNAINKDEESEESTETDSESGSSASEDEEEEDDQKSQPPGSPVFDDSSVHVKPLRMSLKKTPAPSAVSVPDDDGIRVRGSDIPNQVHDEYDGIRVTPSEPFGDDGIRVSPSEPMGDDGIRVTASEPGDGIRVTPSEPDVSIRAPRSLADDDGIRVRGSDIDDDGIRIRPVTDPVDNDAPIPSLQEAEDALSSMLGTSSLNRNDHKQSQESLRKSSKSKKPKPLNTKTPAITAKLPVREKAPNADKSNPRVSRKSTKSKSGRRRTRSLGPPAIRSVRTCSFSTGSSFSQDDDGLSEIPVGNSAFSVLDLPFSDEARKAKPRQTQPPPAKPPIFRDVPNVFKKMVSEGKKILHEVHESSKPAPPKQPGPVRIENWLNNTVEPRVDNEGGKLPIKKAIEKEWAHESQIRKSSAEYHHIGKGESDVEKAVVEPKTPIPKSKVVEKEKPSDKADENEKEKEQEKTPKKQTPEKVNTPHSSTPDAAPKDTKAHPALSPSSITYNNKSPTQKENKSSTSSGLQRKPTGRPKIPPKSQTSKKPLKDALRDVFRGESVGHNLPPTTYESQEERAYEIELTPDEESAGEEWDPKLRRGLSPTESSFSYESRLPYGTGYADSIITDSDMTPAPLRRRAPQDSDNIPSIVTLDDHAQVDADSSQTTDLSDATPVQTNLTQASSVGNEQSKSERDGAVHRQFSYMSSNEKVDRKPSVLSVATTANRTHSNGSRAESSDKDSSFASRQEPLSRNPSFLSGPDTINRSSSYVSGKEVLTRKASKASRKNSAHRHHSQRSHRSNSGGGVKRKLTKHSDLVSVLSIPDGEDVMSHRTSTRSRTSRRSGSQSTIKGSRNSESNQDSIAALLRDFATEEATYVCELKCLVDGVVPVLLKEVLHWDGKTPLFGDPSVKEDSFSKSVVDMGVCLEKLRNSHKKAPLTDIYQLFAWLERVQPIYDLYLDAWRLGFHDIVVNLAPLIDTLDDADSLLDAMPRNDEGDLVDADGSRVDVAHFLKRPLQRLKRMVKFLKGVTKALPSATTTALLESYTHLQDKARRRYNEEIARITDKDATETDTSQCLNLQTMEKVTGVDIDPLRQVNAKDVFSLTLWHSNGQRLECEVELVHRDRPRNYGDPGDLLIRKTNGDKQAWLLFEPITMDYVSARQDEFGIMVMIRGPLAQSLASDVNEWYELLHLRTEDDLQIEDWIAIFSPSPIPAFNRRRVPNGSSAMVSPIAPPQLSTIMEASTEISSVSEVSTPGKDIVVKVKSRRGLSPNTSNPGQNDPTQSERPGHSSPSPEPDSSGSGSDITLKNEQQSDDKPPAPPVHRTLSKSTPPVLAPPEPLRRGIERRGSSPLKHEYLPSEISSEASDVSEGEVEEIYSDPDEYDESMHSGSGSQTGSEDESYTASESSGDEMDSIDMPETELGISIRDEEGQRALRAATASVMTYDTITPSHSASQVGARDDYQDEEQGEAQEVEEEVQIPKFVAKVSQWSDKKAIWKDLKAENCWIVVQAGSLEVHHMGVEDIKVAEPLVALDLTPLILLRQSTFIDLEVRAETLDTGSIFVRHGANFRFRCQNTSECYDLYAVVHNARLKNERYTRKQDELRIKSFGQNPYAMMAGANDGANDGDEKKTNKSWFGRRNSYRAAARAPPQSQAMGQSQDGVSTTPSSNASATSSFLRRLTGGNLSFNLAKSSVDHQAGGAPGSLYSVNSSRGGPGLRAPSLSMASQGTSKGLPLNTDAIRIRLHLLVTQSKWEDWGNCMLTISRPPPGKRMDLRRDHGLEKRVTVMTIPKKSSGDQPVTIIDAVLGSGCFTPMGNRGVVCGIWEEVKDEKGVVGNIPQNGNAAGNITKWCFQCKNGVEAQWVLRNLHQEVELF